jgi:hypothetical protein
MDAALAGLLGTAIGAFAGVIGSLLTARQQIAPSGRGCKPVDWMSLSRPTASAASPHRIIGYGHPRDRVAGLGSD